MDKSSGGSVTRTVTYYPVAGAMRIDSTLYYILKDHLDSASVVTNGITGAVVGEQRYYPFGETRLSTGTIFTDRLFTGQREMAGLGIYHYGARFYSPKLGRFLSADSIIPDTANPQGFNRYSYVYNNPISYVDPTGHKPCWATKKYSCDLSKMTKKDADNEVAKYKTADQQAVINFFQNQGVPVSNGGGNTGGGSTTTVIPGGAVDYHVFMAPPSVGGNSPSAGCSAAYCDPRWQHGSNPVSPTTEFHGSTSEKHCDLCIVLGAAIFLSMAPIELTLGFAMVLEPTPILEIVLFPIEALAVNVSLIGVQFMAQGQNRSFEEVNIDPLPLVHPFFPNFMPDDISTPWYER